MESTNFSKYGVKSVLLVDCSESNRAKVRLWTLEEGLIELGDAYIGRNGTGKTAEGDGKTPLGVFGIRRAFGIKPNPGCKFEYLDIKPGIIACDEPGPFYNQIVDSTLPGMECKGEVMCELVPAYNYGLETDYNSDNVYPLGSAIFIHCKGLKPYTGGCVALDESSMLILLQRATRDLKVVITSSGR